MARPLAIDPRKKKPAQVVTLRLAPQQRTALEKRAKREKVSIAELVRRVLAEAGL
jgi:predicted HicB family RNase H-like nuclease